MRAATVRYEEKVRDISDDNGSNGVEGDMRNHDYVERYGNLKVVEKII